MALKRKKEPFTVLKDFPTSNKEYKKDDTIELSSQPQIDYLKSKRLITDKIK